MIIVAEHAEHMWGVHTNVLQQDIQPDCTCPQLPGAHYPWGGSTVRVPCLTEPDFANRAITTVISVCFRVQSHFHTGEPHLTSEKDSGIQHLQHHIGPTTGLLMCKSGPASDFLI